MLREKILSEVDELREMLRQKVGTVRSSAELIREDVRGSS